MDSKEFEWNCYSIIEDILFEEGCGAELIPIATVWSCKTLQNNKGMFAILEDEDSRYFEITYDGDKERFYVDCYDKIWNKVIEYGRIGV